jgi:hypothetical protein
MWLLVGGARDYNDLSSHRTLGESGINDAAVVTTTGPTLNAESEGIHAEPLAYTSAIYGAAGNLKIGMMVNW